MNLYPVCLILLIAGCQSTHEFLVTPEQQLALATITADVTEQANAMRKDNMLVNRNTVALLLQAQDANVKSILNDQQWHFYDTDYRASLAMRIYRTGVRVSAPNFRSSMSSYQNSLPINNVEPH